MFVTDPDRTPDPVRIAQGLPRGTGVIYRAFGAAEALDTARALRRVCDARGLMLLIGADAPLAAASRADGVHLPERALWSAPRLRALKPLWLITGAAHSPRALAQAAAAGLDAALLSAVFASRSPSAKRPLGTVRFAQMVHSARLPVYALGGVNLVTARRLVASGAVGLAAVDGFCGPGPRLAPAT
jgi:thiamine-phosphate pyrophosphorylase